MLPCCWGAQWSDPHLYFEGQETGHCESPAMSACFWRAHVLEQHGLANRLFWGYIFCLNYIFFIECLSWFCWNGDLVALLVLKLTSSVMVVTKDVKKLYKQQLCPLHLWKEGDFIHLRCSLHLVWPYSISGRIKNGSGKFLAFKIFFEH